MQLSIKTTATTGAGVDLLVLPLPARRPGGAGTRATGRTQATLPRRFAALDRSLGGIVADALATGDFSGRDGESLLLYPGREGGPRRVLLLGLGKPEEFDAERLRRLGGRALGRDDAKGIGRIAIMVPAARRLSGEERAVALAQGILLGSYRFDAYKEKKRRKVVHLKSVDLIFEKLASPGRVRRAVRQAVAVAECQNLARDLSNEPPNELPPSALAKAARKIAREVGLGCRVMKTTELERRGLTALLAVGRGSVHAPHLIVLEHRGPARRRRPAPCVCLVGKGITFDSGGISLKPPANMQEMKHDMSGAAAVLGALRAVALLDLPLHVLGVVAAAENMPSGTAYRPGDIVRSMSGKSIEVVNTDAEGRIVLADALHYACSEFRPEAVVDVATLTGAAMIALGPWATAALGNDESLVEELRAAGEATGERVWPMPLLREHKQAMRSPVADLRNSAGREAGVSTAAAFLSEFVGDTPWVHLDIAGTGWTAKTHPYHRGGATGVGVRLLLGWLLTRLDRTTV